MMLRHEPEPPLYPSSSHVGTDATAPPRRTGELTAIARTLPASTCAAICEYVVRITSA